MTTPQTLPTTREEATREGSHSPASSIRHYVVAFALRAIDRRYGDRGLCLKQVAGEIQCSVWHLGRLLRHETGRGFTAHLRRRRVRAAKALLHQSSLPLKVIAAEAGFATASQFSRQFARVVGTTPTRFRALAAARPDAPEMTSERACATVASTHNR